MNRWIISGSIFGFFSVAFGAFGAHALASRLNEKQLAIYHIGAQYQMYHALALIGLGVFSAYYPQVSTGLAGWSFTLGSVIFAGSLYALALTDIKILGAITPIGGVFFMVGWAAFFFYGLKT